MSKFSPGANMVFKSEAILLYNAFEMNDATIKFIPFRLIPPPHKNEFMHEIEKDRATQAVRRGLNEQFPEFTWMSEE